MTSSAIARSLAQMFGEELRKTKIVSISPVTSATIRELGFEPAAEAKQYTMEGVVRAVLEAEAKSSAMKTTLCVDVDLLLATVCQPAWAQRESEPKHLTVAKEFVQQLDLKNTGYNHGAVEVKFDAPCESHTDCSGFADALLEHCYGLGKDQMKQMFGSGRPTARRYHDAIVEQKGFKQIEDVRDIRPGDFLAIKYLTRAKTTRGT